MIEFIAKHCLSVASLAESCCCQIAYDVAAPKVESSAEQQKCNKNKEFFFYEDPIAHIILLNKSKEQTGVRTVT